MNHTETKQHLVIYKGNRCHDCGHSFPNCCYDFDHRDPGQKSFTISHSNGKPIAELMIEADKCDLVCSNCHRIRTAGNPEVARKISASKKGCKQSPMSSEGRAKISAAHTGKVMSIEARAKIGAAQRGRKRGPMSAEHKARIQASHKARWAS